MAISLAVSKADRSRAPARAVRAVAHAPRLPRASLAIRVPLLVVLTTRILSACAVVVTTARLDGSTQKLGLHGLQMDKFAEVPLLRQLWPSSPRWAVNSAQCATYYYDIGQASTDIQFAACPDEQGAFRAQCIISGRRWLETLSFYA